MKGGRRWLSVVLLLVSAPAISKHQRSRYPWDGVQKMQFDPSANGGSTSSGYHAPGLPAPNNAESTV